MEGRRVWMTVRGHGRFEATYGSTLLEACEEAGVPMEAECGGFAMCNSCRVRVLEGADHLSDIEEEEATFLDRKDQRLGCQACVHGDIHFENDFGME